MSTTLQHHHKSVVSPIRTTNTSGSMVRDEWSCHNCRVGSFVRTRAHPIGDAPVVADVSHLSLLSSSTNFRSIFLFVGLVTIISSPFVYWKLDNDVSSARFLTEHERAQAIERLRANQTGAGSREFKWSHVLEAALEPKTYLFVGMTLLLNVGASVTNTFGPLILSGLGYDKYRTSLLNMPFGALQLIVILLASYAAQKAKLKSGILAIFMLPVVAGLAMLYVLPRAKSDQGSLLAAYYLLAFLFGGNPLIVSWIVGNTGGTTKKSIIMSSYNAGSSAGNIIGPLLFNKKDAPAYHPGLRAGAQACRLLGIDTLRDATPATAATLPPPLDARARHVLTENERVEETVGGGAALLRGDLPHVGELLNASHASLRDDYAVSTPAVERTVQRLHDAGALGARIMGGGFGGHVLGLLPPTVTPPDGATVVVPGDGACSDRHTPAQPIPQNIN